MKNLLLFVFILLPTLALAQSPAPVANYGIVSAREVTPYDCSGTITTGGVAQKLIIKTSPAGKMRGFMIMNVDTTAENLCISFNGVSGAATCNTSGYYALQPATASAAGGSYSSQLGFGTDRVPTVTATTTGHKFSCTYW